ncbi:hypothetical protein Lal_00011342 [Lupinus albus]|uniref:Pulmonary surfactant-associated protein B n=1 Tax=Lupinus albus TaxID=3870 RepID=A0A6A4PHR7_LUPAL|nr:putative saposin [Lupinus albus]KAF1888568.1 hypothetical protein Lal_00011342 [Lupinus albus]
MAERLIGLLFLILLGATWSCDARQLAIANTNKHSNDTAILVLHRKIDVCELCEQYTTEALEYLDDKNNQNEIIGTLHDMCYRMLSFKKQCIELMDYYVPIFFSQVASAQPRELCKKFNLCPDSAKISSQVQENNCDFCKDTVTTLVDKLKDPDTELQIMQVLLKVCDSMEKLKKNCKKMVLEYGPLIFFNAENFLKPEEICTALHACPATTQFNQEVPLVSDL